MKTHELANALRALASALKNSPNVDVQELKNLGASPVNKRPSEPSTQANDLPLALGALLSLSRIDKQEWLQLIADLGLNIEIRPRDASRDIVGKVLRVLEKDPQARSRLSAKVKSKEKPASPELAKALSSLLNF